MDKPKNRIVNTTQLLTMIKRTSNFGKIDKALSEVESTTKFCHYLYEVMTAHGFTAKEVIAASGMERSYFYHILSGKKSPSRNIVIRISLCINATLAETNQLLRLSMWGPLYAKIRRDAAIIYSIEHKYTMRQTNDFLKSLGETPLYKDD